MHQLEVDFIISDHTAIGVKVSRNVSPKDQKNLLNLAEEGTYKNLLIESTDPFPKIFDSGVQCLPINDFVE